MSMTCIKVENVNFHYNLQKQEHTITDLSFTAGVESGWLL